MQWPSRNHQVNTSTENLKSEVELSGLIQDQFVNKNKCPCTNLRKLREHKKYLSYELSRLEQEMTKFNQLYGHKSEDEHEPAGNPPMLQLSSERGSNGEKNDATPYLDLDPAMTQEGYEINN